MKLSGSLQAVEFNENEITNKKENIYRYTVVSNKSNYQLILYTSEKTISIDISSLIKELKKNI